MLDIALKFVVDELNAYLKAKTGLTDNVVQLSSIVDDAGKYAMSAQTIAMSLINIEQERIDKQQLPSTQFVGGKTLSYTPELKLNLYVMFSARFSMYDQALKHLSHVMNFFQKTPLFTPQTHSSMDFGVARMSLDLQSTNYDQLNQIWAFLGAKHLPSVFYKIRVVTLRDHEVPDVGPPVLVVNANVNSQ